MKKETERQIQLAIIAEIRETVSGSLPLTYSQITNLYELMKHLTLLNGWDPRNPLLDTVD